MVVGVAAVAVQLAAMTGDGLSEQVRRSRLIETHEMWAGRLQAATWVLAAVMLVAFWALPHVTGLREGQGRPGRLVLLHRPLVVALPVLALAVVVLVVLTGDAGARAVWAS